jgi:putative ABC transport system permease protein
VTYSDDDGHPIAQDYYCLYPRADGLRRYGKTEELPRLAPTDDAVVIDEKLASNLGIREGDIVKLLDRDEKEYPVQVCGICENYVGHYVYMTPACYTKLFGEKPRDNLLLVKTVNGGQKSGAASPSDTDLSPSAVAQRVSGIKGVITYNSIDETRDHFNESMKSLDVVVWIIIGAAAALAFLVLFNLTNINVTERIRELATLKVLGFYDGETASYVYRENIILTLMGAMLGMLGGKWLHRWLIGTIEMEYMIFGHGLHARSYLYAIILTVIFSMSVNFFSYFYIRRIDMVESLKSVE